MSSVVISGDTSGAITLAVPAVAGTNTVTLPAAAGTVMVSGNMPAFNAYNSNQQSISSGVFTKLQFNTEVFDTNSNYDNATNYRFTPTVAGYYQFSWYFLPSSSTTSSICRLYKNGSFLYNPFAGNGLVNSLSGGSAVVYMNGSTDYVEVYGYLVGASPLVESGQNANLFCGVMVRSA
jgi:hypothetical protein